MKVYLAASSDSIDELNHHADSLRWAGHEVRVGEFGEGVDKPDACSWPDVVVLCGDDPEVGMCTQDVGVKLARARGKQVFVVGSAKWAANLGGEVRHFPRWGRRVLDALEDLW